MSTVALNQFLTGGIAMACFAIGLFFFRYWRGSHDRFFLFLMMSFWLEAGNRIDMAVSNSWTESAPGHYLVRLISYALILIGIWDMNRTRGD